MTKSQYQAAVDAYQSALRAAVWQSAHADEAQEAIRSEHFRWSDFEYDCGREFEYAYDDIRVPDDD